jgi:FMN phosphatase YigB (HAD superfamily)/glycosyltransferase involved in cell wall biosynthesis
LIEQIRVKNRTRFITAAFRGKFLREPSPAELSYWDAKLQSIADFQQFLREITQAATSEQGISGLSIAKALPLFNSIPFDESRNNCGLPSIVEADIEVIDDFVNAITRNLEKSELITFDIWDTVLRRTCDPDEIKLRAARVLWLVGTRPNENHNQITPTKLYWLRKEAERNVADEHYEYKIESVLQEWLKLHCVGELALIHNLSAQILQSELLAERTATQPDTTILELLRSIKGKRTLAISDFYHTSENLASILEHHGLRSHFDRIYVSCDWMKTKRAGSLYDLVLQEEKIHPAKIIHVGDNPHADHEKASEKGIQAYLYQNLAENKRTDELKKTFEDYLAGNPKRHYKNILGLLDYSRHVSPTGDMANIADLAVAGKLLSPIAVGFVLSCMQEAIRRQCPRIFFFAREGIFFKRIYEELVNLDIFDLGQYPQPEILYVSRRATFAASLRQLSLDEMMRMWNMYSSQTVTAMARSLNLDTESVAVMARNYGIEPHTPIQYPWQNEPFKAFFHSPEFQAYAEPALAQQKAGLMQHLEHAGFEPEATIDRVIVDIGWRGTIQDNISCLVNGNVHGVYLALKTYLNQQPGNSTKSAFLSDDNNSDPFELCDVAALEFILNAPGGSCIGYDHNGTPQKEIFAGEETIINNQVAAIQAGILEGTVKLGQYIRRHGLIAQDITPLARHLVTCYLNTPPTCIADAFLALEHNETFGTGDADQFGLDTNVTQLSALSDAELHTALNQIRFKQRWPASLYSSRQFKDLFAMFRPDQTLNIPCSGERQSIFSIIRPEIRRDIVSLITPAPLAGSGGHQTIYNFAKGLAREGFDVHLMLEGVNSDLCYVEQELAGHRITLHKKWNAGIRPQVAVATVAYSAKYVHEFFPDTIGAYFVQDYEAEFNSMSDSYVSAQNSYALGLAPICIGHWLPNLLRQQFGIGAAYCGLGVDTSIYRTIPQFKKKTSIAFLYQPDKKRRMSELCLDALKIVKQQRPETEIVLYGSDSSPNLSFEVRNLGLVNDLERLNQLYNEASVGLCLSSTNPSRIPFEFMAAGCVPVDLYRSNNLFDYEDESALLAYQSQYSIAEAILYLLDNSDILNKRRENGLKIMSQRTLTWEVDAAVNAIKHLLLGRRFDSIDCPTPSYNQTPFISDRDMNRAVTGFCSGQWNELI